MTPILVHACCAHCLSKTLAGLKAEPSEMAPIIYWVNPNIHPLIEWRRRLKAVKMLAERASLQLIADETYGLVEFCRAIHGSEAAPERCARCYSMRLERAAQMAREKNCACFTSTLVTSRHQDHAQIRAAGEAAATASGVPFLYRDWRDAPPDEQQTAMLYHQQYCGCIFSEFDRFKDTRTHLWPNNNLNNQ